ncbi:site-specific integrase [Paraburkholderia sp. RL17-347-BIC-D]|uniref:site-specific integrase n=1 Tax=Paraburkholderia sp. RL17-347-BIC-D TaxID=3031632 RepID=UPI0038B70915
MANIRKRKNGRFQAVVRVMGFPIETHSFDKLEDATLWASFRERELGELMGEHKPADAAMTLREALLRYKTEVAAHKKSWHQEFKRIACWLRHPLADKPLRDISGADLSQHQRIRLELGRKPNTIRLELALISHLFEVARADWGLEFLSNPRKAMRRAPLGGQRDRRLRPGEFEALMAWCDRTDNPLFKTMLVLAIETAMRRGELLNLLWENVDLHQQLAYLPDTKNGTPRTVPLSSRAIASLRTLPSAKTGPLFSVHENWITKRFTTARTECELPNLRFHDLRHEAVSRLFEKGFNMMEAATVSGHKTLQMLKRYTHLDPRGLLARLG